MKWKVTNDTADAVMRLTKTPDWKTVEKYLKDEVLLDLYRTSVAQLSQADRNWHAGRASLLEELLKFLDSDHASKDKMYFNVSPQKSTSYFGGI